MNMNGTTSAIKKMNRKQANKKPQHTKQAGIQKSRNGVFGCVKSSKSVFSPTYWACSDDIFYFQKA